MADEIEDFMEDQGEQEWEQTEGERLAKVLPESPASANLKVYIDGFGAMITIRGTESQALVAQIEEMVKIAKLKGWMPSWNTETNKAFTPKVEVKDTPNCGIHGNPMVWKEGNSKTTGRHYAFWGCPTKNADNSFCSYKYQG